MIGRYLLKNAWYFMILLALTGSLAANATLLDCSKNQALSGVCVPTETLHSGYVLKDAIPAPAPVAKVAAIGGFQLNQVRTARAIPASVLLLCLVCALLSVVLLRAKSANSK